MADQPHTFVMDMFPYPSGAGLHVGHPLGYIGTDVYARYLRMRGENVLHTMGFDAFGLPAEQYALQTGQHPAHHDRQQHRRSSSASCAALGLAHDQRRGVATTDPGVLPLDAVDLPADLQLLLRPTPTTGPARPVRSRELIAELDAGTARAGRGHQRLRQALVASWTRSSAAPSIDRHRLAYVAELPVNWCPGLGTVLANEEVTADGRSERGNFPVFRKPLAQWMLRITAYADRLLADLDHIDWPEKVRTMQRNWIGRSIGAHIDFRLAGRRR